MRQWRLLGARTIELAEAAVPEPRGEELLLRVLAATTCGTDLKVFRRGGHPRMLLPPCPFGHEVCGEVVAVGPDQRRWAVGQRVVVANSAPCGVCRECRRRRENLCADLHYLNGAFADHLLVPARFAAVGTHAAPDGLTPAEAALAEPLACALHCLEVVEAGAGRWLDASDPPADGVVLGAGPLGLLLVGLLARRGLRVACADPHPQRLEVASAFGAAETIEASDRERPLAPDRSFDLTVDATGAAAGWAACLAASRAGGAATFFGGTTAGVELAVDAHALHYGERSLLGVYHHRPANVARALELLAAEALPHRLLLSARLPLEGLDRALEMMERRAALKVALEPA
jgi:L-iditol 2-dehydrogenase